MMDLGTNQPVTFAKYQSILVVALSNRQCGLALAPACDLRNFDPGHISLTPFKNRVKLFHDSLILAATMALCGFPGSVAAAQLTRADLFNGEHVLSAHFI